MLGIVSLALVGGALYVQIVKGEDPCPLCIIQRYAFIGIAIFSLGAACCRLRSLGRNVLKGLAAICAIGGMATSIHHVMLLSHPGFSCGFDRLEPIVDSLPFAKIFPMLFKVSGLCETPYPPIFGLSLPMWACVGYSMALVCLLGSFLNRGRRG